MFYNIFLTGIKFFQFKGIVMRKNFSNFAMLTHNGLTEVLQTYQPILAAR